MKDPPVIFRPSFIVKNIIMGYWIIFDHGSWNLELGIDNNQITNYQKQYNELLIKIKEHGTRNMDLGLFFLLTRNHRLNRDITYGL